MRPVLLILAVAFAVGLVAAWVAALPRLVLAAWDHPLDALLILGLTVGAIALLLWQAERL